MGCAIIEQAIETLRAAGFRTQRAYPGTELPNISQVVAAVQLAKMDMENQVTVLDVQLLCPQMLGAQACEDAAFTAAEALKALDLSCVIGTAKFDGKSGMFCISCKASTFQMEKPYLDITFKIGAVVQERVVSFTAQRQTDAEGTSLQAAPWTVRLEQFTRNGFSEDTDPEGDTFTVTHGKEIYHGCKWTSCQRIREIGGLRQIREGVATHRTSS